ncbi:metalloproteinase inhibitor 2-like [Phyllopteryx taeniolatus]|uniref:metalloproteinase inhibitor 2-like n=1 Tax=Phyllopteryx taeniolatus TaxID=161469 RepID=UPI002AD39664|nr:metalloproteinase inhibitor 2-like [Phyllopteryx taeniolatus]
MKIFTLPLVLLCFWRPQEGVQACTCLPTHPQQVFCRSDVVIRAKVVGVTTGTQVSYYEPIKYHIHQIKLFKGPQNYFDAIYTAPNSAACGVTLSIGIEYLLMASLQPDGSLYISLCDSFQPWDALSVTQKKLLNHYGKGCNCKITPCFTLPCVPSSKAECLWTDFLALNTPSGHQARNFACVQQRRGGVCFWKRGNPWYKSTQGRHPY